MFTWTSPDVYLAFPDVHLTFTSPSSNLPLARNLTLISSFQLQIYGERWVDQPITTPISGSSHDISETYPGVKQDVREDPELDNILSNVFIHVFILRLNVPFPITISYLHTYLMSKGNQAYLYTDTNKRDSIHSNHSDLSASVKFHLFFRQNQERMF